MVKKVLFVFTVLFGLVFFQMAGECLADVLEQLGQVETYKWYPSQAEQICQTIETDHPGTDYAVTAQKNLVLSYLAAKREADAQQALDKLKADYSGNSTLPAALYEIARIYERSRNYQKANNLYQQIMQQHPESASAGKAQLASQRMNVLSFIDSKNDDAAKTAIESLAADFAVNSELPSALYDIARRYERAKAYEKAKSIYQQIIQDYPGNSAANKAQLAIARVNIFLLIKSDDASATGEISNLVSNFPGQSDLPEALYDIGIRYERMEKYGEAKGVYQQIIQNHADTSHSSRAQLNISKMDIVSSIKSGDYSSAHTVLDSLTGQFAEHCYLPAVLCDIARIYEWAGKYQEAKDIYEQVAQQYSQSAYAPKVQLKVPKNNILSLIETGNDSAAQTELDEMIADFAGNKHLPWTVCRIAKQYHTKAGQLEGQGLTEQAMQQFQKAAVIYERVVNELPASTATAEACSIAGNWYRKIGEYEKSTQYYRKIADDYSGHQFAWYALFLVGRNYEKMSKEGLISESEAEPKIKAAYQELIEKYPDCKAVKAAQDWLDRYNSN